MLTGHFPVCEGARGCQAFIDESCQFVDRLELALRDVLADGTVRTLPWLCGMLAPRLGPWPGGAERHLAAPILGHLERAEAAGRVLRVAAESGVTGWRSNRAADAVAPVRDGDRGHAMTTARSR